MLVFQEIDVQNKKAIVISVPVPQLKAYQKIQTRLVRELEKKFSGKHVIFIAQVTEVLLWDVLAYMNSLTEIHEIWRVAGHMRFVWIVLAVKSSMDWILVRLLREPPAVWWSDMHRDGTKFAFEFKYV